MSEIPLEEYSDDLRSVWNNTYSAERRNALWGDSAVPFVSDAMKRFQAARSRLVLDLGCGEGRNTGHLARTVPYVVAADISVPALDICRQRLDREGVQNALLMEVDAFRTPFRDEQFDGLFCANLLGQVKHPEVLVREALRITRAGAPVVFNVLSTDDPSFVDGMTRDSGAGHMYAGKFYYRFFEREQVLAMFDGLGLSHVDVRASEWTDPPHEGYREESHQHRSWVTFALKGGGTK